MQFLRTNTATRITVGPFLDKTDGVTPETAITVTAEKLTFVVDTGGVPTLVLDVAPTASGGSNDMVHITGDDAGFYDLELAAADVNYLGRARLALTDATVHCPVFHEYMILPANVYDSLVLGTDALDVSAIQFAGQTITCSGGVTVPAATLASTTNITAATGITVSTNSDKTGYGLSSAAIQAIWDALTSALTTVGSIGKLLVDNINATISSRSTYAGGAVASVTGDVGGNVVGSVASVTAAVTVGTNNDKTGYSIGVGGLASTAFAAGAVDAAALAAGASEEIADTILLRKLDRSGNGTDLAEERTVVNALRGVRNKATISGGTLTVTKEDDSTTAWTATVTTAAGNPLSGVDPT